FDFLAVRADASQAFAGQEDSSQLVAEQNQPLGGAGEDPRFGAAVRSQFVDFVGVAVILWSRLVFGDGATRIHHSVKMLEVFIVDIAVRTRLTGVRMRLVD